MVETSTSQISVYPIVEWENAIKLDVETFIDITSKLVDDDTILGVVSRNKVGRKKSITIEDWYNAVIKYNTLSDKELARELGIGHSTVYRRRVEAERDDENRDKYYIPALEHIERMSNLELNVSLRSFNNFKNLKIVKKFEQTLITRKLKPRSRDKRLRALFNMCVYLNKHPRKLNLEDVADRVVESRQLFEAGEKAPKGLSYSNQRKAMRSFFIYIIKYVNNEESISWSC